MNDVIEAGVALSDVERMIAEGAIRKGLGLESADLEMGLHVARNQLKRGGQVEAFRTYIALVLCEPSNVEFQIGLANCALKVEENHLALQAASAIVALEPRNPRGYFLSGRACLALGYYAEADEDLRDALHHARIRNDKTIIQESEQLIAKMAALKS